MLGVNGSIHYTNRNGKNMFLRRAARCRITDQKFSEYIREKLKNTDNSTGIGHNKNKRGLTLKCISWGDV
jgi:hypothetical protein